MSLVSEALKKAQREATARQGRALGLPEPPPLQPFRARPRRRRGRLVGAGLGLAALLVLLGAYFARSGPGAPATEAGGSSATEAAAPAAAAAGAAVQASTPLAESPLPSQAPAARAAPPGASESPRPLEPSLAPGAPPAAGAARPTRGGEPLQPAARGAAPLPAAAPPDARTEAATAADTSEPEAPAAPPPARPATARDFVRRAELPDGTVLELGGIAYSASAPFAYVNGRLLAAGETVAGYRVESIARDRVVLTAGGERITLRLKAP